MGGYEATFEKFLTIPIEGPLGFFRVSDIAENGEEFDGMERGTYAWNPTTGTFSATPIVVTSGSSGFNHSIPDFVSITGDELTFTDSVGSDAVNRVGSIVNNLIVGAWQFGDSNADASGPVVFLPSGIHFLAVDIADNSWIRLTAVFSAEYKSLFRQ